MPYCKIQLKFYKPPLCKPPKHFLLSHFSLTDTDGADRLLRRELRLLLRGRRQACRLRPRRQIRTSARGRRGSEASGCLPEMRALRRPNAAGRPRLLLHGGSLTVGARTTPPGSFRHPLNDFAPRLHTLDSHVKKRPPRTADLSLPGQVRLRRRPGGTSARELQSARTP